MKTSRFVLTKRDYEILGDIAQCGVLTAEQIGLYHFGPTIILKTVEKKGAMYREPTIINHSNAVRRLKWLREGEFIRRVKAMQVLSDGKQPYVYTVTAKGAAQLAGYLDTSIDGLVWRKKDSRLHPTHLAHSLMINDVIISIKCATRALPSVSLVEWQDTLMLHKTHSEDRIEYALSDGTKRQTTVIPDAYVLVRDAAGGLHHSFLEADRGTESNASKRSGYQTWQHKVFKYLGYFSEREENGYRVKSLFESRYDAPSGRILTITTSPKRLENMVTASEQIGAKVRFWFTTIQDLQPRIEERQPTDKGYRPPKFDAFGNRLWEARDYKVVIPNILSDPIWTVATKLGEKHAINERFPTASAQD